MAESSELCWRITKKDYFLQNNAKVNCASFHPSSNLLVVGFSNGLFGLYELPEFNQIHLLRYVQVSFQRRIRTLIVTSISQSDIDFVGDAQFEADERKP